MTLRTWLVRLACPVLMLVLALAPSARAQEAAPASPAPADSTPRPPDPRLFLTWRAPYGQPRATDVLTTVCGDTTRADTLYMCLDPMRDSPTLNGYTATVEFHALPPDSLPVHFRFGHLNDAPRGVRVLLEPDSSRGVPSPFGFVGISRWAPEWTPQGSRLRMIFAVAEQQAGPVRAGRIYLLARIVVSRPRRGDPACRQPISVQWSAGSLAWKIGGEEFFEHSNTFAAINGPVESSSAPFRTVAGAKPWKPPVK